MKRAPIHPRPVRLADIVRQARKYRKTYSNPHWRDGFWQGVDHAIKACEDCLSGEERMVEDGYDYGLPRYGQPNLNEFLDKVRAFRKAVQDSQGKNREQAPARLRLRRPRGEQ